MNNSFNYRTGSANDIPQLINLALVSYGQYGPTIGEENLLKMKTNISNEETWKGILNTAKSFLCEVDNKIVGMAFLIPSGNPWDIFKSEWSYIRMVGVHPDFQGNGIAKKLTEQCITHAIATKEKTIALHTSEMMVAARNIYEKLGFKILQEIPPRLGQRYWLYTRDLH